LKRFVCGVFFGLDIAQIRSVGRHIISLHAVAVLPIVILDIFRIIPYVLMHNSKSKPVNANNS
jgi:hypothetical protein